MRTFLADFMKDYNSTGLPLADICDITFGRLGAFLHLALFHAWSDAMQYVARRGRKLNSRWIVALESMPCLLYIPLLDRRSTVCPRLLRLQRTRGLCISCLQHHIHAMREQHWICQHLLLRRGNGGHRYIAHASILVSYVSLRVFFLLTLH